jgi:hypothetical protein
MKIFNTKFLENPPSDSRIVAWESVTESWTDKQIDRKKLTVAFENL